MAKVAKTRVKTKNPKAKSRRITRNMMNMRMTVENEECTSQVTSSGERSMCSVFPLNRCYDESSGREV